MLENIFQINSVYVIEIRVICFCCFARVHDTCFVYNICVLPYIIYTVYHMLPLSWFNYKWCVKNYFCVNFLSHLPSKFFTIKNISAISFLLVKFFNLTFFFCSFCVRFLCRWFYCLRNWYVKWHVFNVVRHI